MRIAVIDHIGNHGGGSRVVRSLLPAMKALAPDATMTLFGNAASIRREQLDVEFSRHGIDIVPLRSLSLLSLPLGKSGRVRRAVQQAQNRWFAGKDWLPVPISGDVSREVELLVKGYDLAFFPWPFFLAFPELDCPVVGIFHDFNFKYYFSGVFAFSESQREQLERDMPVWLARCTPVVSTHFMASELERFYPAATARTRVIHLPPLGGMEPISLGQQQKTVRELGIEGDYLLYPTQMCSHKNVGPLIVALSLLRARGHQVRLVLTGAGTETIKGKACEVGLRLTPDDWDVIGLGYVSNSQIDCLIQGATAVVSTSLYEAGNGPGLDAWGRGVPVAMSSIPAFTEHLDVLGVRAQVFDPFDPRDIAEKIATLLHNREASRADAEFSRQALTSHTWNETAAGYLRVFRDVVSGVELGRPHTPIPVRR